MRKISLIISTIFMSSSTIFAQTDSLFLKKLLESKPDLFANILQHPQHNEVQVMYTQINRDAKNKPNFKTYTYRINPKRYFYPASTVKLAAVIFALEKINRLNIPGLSAYSTMITDSAYKGQTKVIADPSAKDGKPSIAHYIKKVLLTSDNDAYNRLFEFIGREEINSQLKKYGMNHSRIVNRLAIGDGGEREKNTNPIRFYNGSKLVYHQAAQYDPNNYPLELENLIVGKGYMNAKEQYVDKPYSFENKNVFTIADQQNLMMRLMMPEAFPKDQRYLLKPDDYKLIYTYMSKLPTESDYPKYDPKEFWPTYAKMLYYGREKDAKIEPNIRIFNKYGDSYGFIIDNAYIVDFKNGIEFFLTAVVQSNEDGIYNDGKYEYETVCFPFMKNLGRVIYEQELKRTKERQPKLDRYKMSY